jgi:hypothetical protein
MIISKKVIELKILILILSATLSNIFLVLRRIEVDVTNLEGTWWFSWLRHCDKSWKVAGIFPSGDIAVFHLHNLPPPLWPWGGLSLLT